MPNITGTAGRMLTQNSNYSGCISKADSSGGYFQQTGGGDTFKSLYFDASRSSSIYQDNAHVRPLSMTTAFLIKY